MLHCVQQLVLVDKVADHEVSKTSQEDLPRVFQNAVNHTDYEDKESLRQEEAIAEDRRLHKFRVVYFVSSYSPQKRRYIPLGVLAPIK